MKDMANIIHASGAVCLDNTGCAVSLEKGKLCQGVADPDAAAFGEVRVVDETGEEYLFPARRFALIDLPPAVKDALLEAHPHD